MTYKEYSRRLTTEQQMPASPSPLGSVRPRRFRIGLSYASERRLELVGPVADLLADADTIGREAVLYDGFLGAEFDRFRLDGYLAELYRDECELIVVFLCPEYVKKEWCQLEWAYIKRLVGTPEDRRIMLLSVGSFGEAERSAFGLGPGDYAPNVDGWLPARIAQRIMDRLPPTARSWTRDERHDELKQLFERFQRESTDSLKKVLGELYELELVWEPGERAPATGRLRDGFRENDRLLVLGEPGSGKSVALAQLARDLEAKVRSAPEPKYIPLYLSLSSWQPSDEDFSAWLTRVLNRDYSCAPKDVSTWIASNALLPLLDGLDEVPPDDRPGCVTAINRYLEKHGARLVVASRPTAGPATERLDVQAEIVLMPLSEEAVKTCLARAGTELATLATAVGENRELAELAHSPLMLRLMIEAFPSAASTELGPILESPIADRPARVVEAWVRKMEERPGSDLYDRDRTRRSLAWFARQLKEHRMVRFEIERLQPTWLASPWRWAYAILSRGLAGALVAAIFIPANRGYWFLPLYGLIAGGVIGVIDALPLWTAPTSGRARDNIWQSVARVASLGIAAFLVFRLLWPAGDGTTPTPIAFMILLGAVNGFVFGLRPGDLRADTRFVDTWRWDWSGAWKGGLLGAGLLCGMALAVSALLKHQHSVPRDLGLTFLLVGWFFLLFSGLLAGGIIGGLKGSKPEVQRKSNQGLRQTAWTSFQAFLLGLLSLTILPMALNLALDLRIRAAGAWVGVVVGLLVALWFGGMDILQHLLLRSLLRASGRFPWRWIRFLDHGVRRGLLYKVEGGYEFPHGMVRDYFVSLWERRSAAPRD